MFGFGFFGPYSDMREMRALMRQPDIKCKAAMRSTQKKRRQKNRRAGNRRHKRGK